MPYIRPSVFLDFDGTITTRDVTDAILEQFADPDWLRVEEAWKTGEIGSRECLTAQMALVRATQPEINSLLDAIDIDPGFAALLSVCSAHRVPVSIVSDGFDYCIDRILRRPSLNLAQYLTNARILSSHLVVSGTHCHVAFAPLGEACAHGCATCKPAAMERLNERGAPTIFVGDGLSDRYAATYADLVFAKDMLATFCDDHTIPYLRYNSLATIAEWIEDVLHTHVRFSTSGGGAVRAV